MKKSFQLSLIILIIFTILVLGVVGDVNQGKRQCWEEIKGKDLCSTRRNECSPRCIKKYPKGGSTCVPTPQGGKKCLCGHFC
ncbi:unnamed protein product [Arabidopsis lyrata]|nr:unnamed protein product [Arabidopsis lyrata]